MEKQLKEIAVIVEGEQPGYFDLVPILKQSQEMAARRWGAKALAVYKVEPQYGR